VAILGFAGLSWREDALSFDPQLPASWRGLGFRVQWQGRRLKARIEQPGPVLSARLEAGEALTLTVSGEPHLLGSGQAIRVPIQDGARPVGKPCA
jgi:alpha,alpha-trehalose phosphorylase